MPLPSSQISLSEIQSYLGGSSPTTLSEYYIDGLYTRGFPSPTKKVPVTSAGNRGYIVGGYTGSTLSASTESISFSNGTTYNIASLIPSKPINVTSQSVGYDSATLSSATVGYICGGALTPSASPRTESDTTDQIVKLNFSTETFNLSSSNIYRPDNAGVGVGNSKRGFIIGGNRPFNFGEAICTEINYSTEAVSLLSVNSGFGFEVGFSLYGGCSVMHDISQNGYIVGGSRDPLRVDAVSNDIYVLNFSTNTNRSSNGKLSIRRVRLSSSYSSSTGYFFGGYGGIGGTNSPTNEIDGLILNTETAINPSAMLSVTRNRVSGMGNDSRGYIGGGNTDFNVPHSSIDVFDMVTQTMSVNGSSLKTAKHTAAGLSARTIIQNEINFSDFNNFIPYSGYFVGGTTSDESSGLSDISSLSFITEIVESTNASISHQPIGGSTGINSPFNGYVCGGQYSGRIIDKFSFQTQTLNQLSTSLKSYHSNGVGLWTSTTGYLLGGELHDNGSLESPPPVPPHSNNFTSNETYSPSPGSITLARQRTTGKTGIESLAFSTDTTTTETISLSTSRARAAAVSSKTVGYTAGGYSGYTKITQLFPSGERASYNTLTSVQTLEYNNTTIGVLSASFGAKLALTSVNSNNAGYFCYGLETYPFVNNKLNKLTYSTNTVAVLSTSLVAYRRNSTGVSSDKSGYVSGGNTTIDCMSFATETASILNSALPFAKSYMTGLYSV